MAWMIATDENLEHLKHYGVPGMEWGVRRFLDESGHLTAAGRERYSTKRTKYSQSEGLKKRKAAINETSNRINALGGQKDADSKMRRAALREQLKKMRSSYSADSKAERQNYTLAKQAEREEMRREREGLKEVHNYTQYNNAMKKSLERASKFTELMGKYNKHSKTEIEAKKASQTSKINEIKNENERIRNQDVREATSTENLSRLRARMKGYKRRSS